MIMLTKQKYLFLIFLLDILLFACNRNTNNILKEADESLEKNIEVNNSLPEKINDELAEINDFDTEINFDFMESVYSFEQIKDIEKIRWINCGEDNFDLPLADALTFSFKILPSERYFKIFDLEKNQYKTPGEGEKYALLEGTYYLYYEFKNNYFVTNFSDSYYTYLLKQKDSYFISKNGYNLGSFHFDNGNEYLREDGEKFSANDLCTKYTKLNDEELYSIIEPFENTDLYIGTVSVTDNNQTIQERGNHFIYYNQEKSSFYSDAMFAEKGYDFGKCGNDSFVIKVMKYDEDVKLLLLDTPAITRPYVPMEDFFTIDTGRVIVTKPYEQRNASICCYNDSDFDSEVIKELPGNKRYYVTIIDAKENLEEFNNEISKWVKVKFDDGFECWIWGRDIILFDSTSNYDLQKVKRYVKYNTVK